MRGGAIRDPDDSRSGRRLRKLSDEKPKLAPRIDSSTYWTAGSEFDDELRYRPRNPPLGAHPKTERDVIDYATRHLNIHLIEHVSKRVETRHLTATAALVERSPDSLLKVSSAHRFPHIAIVSLPRSSC